MTTITADADLGEITRKGDDVEVVFHRRYAKPLAKVWAAITVPERLADWLAEMKIDGERVTITWPAANYSIESRIVANEPMSRFAWTWPNEDGSDSIVSFELAPDGEGCRLTLRQSGMRGRTHHGQAAGWHAHLEGLEDAAEGRKTAWATVLEREKPLKPIYEAKLAG